MTDAIAIAGERDLEAALATLARAQRMVFIAGLPGVGKSLFIRELAAAAHAAARSVHLLQWDVARPALETPAIRARYPERGGISHPMIRKAVGQWARGAVSRWHREHPDPAHILIGEVPLIGNRLLDLAQVQADDAEALLASADVLFVVPVPSIAVRAAIERARGRTFANPAHPRESADAPPDVMRLAWQEIHALAVTLGAARPAGEEPAPFDPAAYAAVYHHLLRHRRMLMLRVDATLAPRQSVYDLDVAATELVPTADEASAILSRLERDYTTGEIERDAAGWFHSV
jgi:hypothetical protein